MDAAFPSVIQITSKELPQREGQNLQGRIISPAPPTLYKGSCVGGPS